MTDERFPPSEVPKFGPRFDAACEQILLRSKELAFSNEVNTMLMHTLDALAKEMHELKSGRKKVRARYNHIFKNALRKQHLNLTEEIDELEAAAEEYLSSTK